MNLGLQGKCAAVAAGSAGLGHAVARALVREGARVAICGRNEDKLTAAARGIGATPIVADLDDAGQARGFVERATRELGAVDILVLNTGGPRATGFRDSDLGDYEAALRSMLLSAVAMCQAAVPAMTARGWGRVLAITSLTAREPRPGNIMSGTARAGLTAFLKALALDVAARGVTVNSLQPGPHDTDRMRVLHPGSTRDLLESIPVRRIGRPEDFAEIAAFVCSEHARFVTGASIPVDGGLHAGL